MVIKLAMENKNYRTISKITHVSFIDIGKIIRKYNDEKPQHQNKNPSVTSKALQMFKEGKSRVDVAIALNLNLLMSRASFVIIWNYLTGTD